MTVIAWDGRTLAADKRCGNASRTVTKVRRAKDGCLCAMTGHATQDAEIFAWYDRGADPADYPNHQRDKETCSLLVAIDRAGVVRVFDGCAYPYIVEDRQWATGSGRDAALAAMLMGATAKEAVEVASAILIDCGNGVDTLRHEE